MSDFGVIRSPRLALFGCGERAALPGVMRSFGTRAFVCTDDRWRLDPDLLAMARELTGAGCLIEIYDGTRPELPLDCVEQAAERARAFDPDVIVGIGGGSCLDLAKLVALGVSHAGPFSTYYGEFKVPGPVRPVVAVPTTAGTGSEVTPVAVVADPERITKVGISSPYLIPDVAICDPELTISCPPRLTAIVGADAMTHAIEAFTAVRRPAEPAAALERVFVGKNRSSDVTAREAIRMLASALPRAVADGSERAAREQVMFGAFSAGQAFGVAGTAAAHAIQYPIGALTGTPHGLGVAALMPYVMAFNLPARAGEIAEIGDVMGLRAGGSEEARGLAAIEAVAGLFAGIGIPATLAELGLGADRIEWVAAESLAATRLVSNNPRLLDHDAVTAIVSAAHAGRRDLLLN